jgi:predicted DNA-binding transcriptional regulator AlpA
MAAKGRLALYSADHGRVNDERGRCMAIAGRISEMAAEIPQSRAEYPDAVMLDLEGARRFLGGLSRSFFYKLISENIIPGPVALGGRSLWPRCELEEVVHKLSKGPRKPRPAVGAGRKRRSLMAAAVSAA